MNSIDKKCSLSVAAEAIGGKWKPVVLYCLLGGPKRFGELRRMISGISERMLALAVRDLEAYGLITRTIYLEIPPRVEYALTPKGYTLKELLFAMRDWGRDAFAS